MNPKQINQRIARNTVYLYIRMAIIMIVSLYTSRILFNSLGEKDYGLNNVVAGVVLLFSYFNNSLSAATSRFITFRLGTNDYEALGKVFCNSFYIHLFLAIIVFVIGETVGLYIVTHILQIPDNRMLACLVAYQMVVFSALMTIVRVPFYAVVFSYEKMNIIALVGIIEAVAKCVIAITLMFTSYDKLILLSILNFVVTLFTSVFYVLYCKLKNDRVIKVYPKLDCKIIKEMLGFTTWSLLGSTAIVLKKQGINILINVFFGPVVNAANAIAVTVNHAVTNFTSNFTSAVNPQIIKTYAANEREQTKLLIFRSGKISYFLLMFLCIPLIFETDFILKLWLGNFPIYTKLFTRLILILSMIEAFSYSVGCAFQANGNIRNMQLTTSFISLLIFPLSYILYKLKFEPVAAFWVMIVISSILNIVYLYYIKKLLDISPIEYSRRVYLPCFMMSILSIPIPYCVYINMQEGWVRFLVMILVVSIVNIITMLICGFEKSERTYILNCIRTRIIKI